MLKKEAKISNIPVQILAQIVVKKADAYKIFSATVAGIRTKHQGIISKMTDVNEIMSYVIEEWPSL